MNDTAAENDNMCGAYDFENAEPNHLAEYPRQGGVRQLDIDVRLAFPDSESVNTALRLLMRVTREAGKSEPSQKPEMAELPKAN